jgi:hypothetical protein
MGVTDARLVDLDALCKLMVAHKAVEVTIGDVRVVLSPAAFQAPPQSAMPLPALTQEPAAPPDEELLYASSPVEQYDPEEDVLETAIKLENPFAKSAP